MVRGKRPKLTPSGGARPNEFKRDSVTYEFRQRVLLYFATHSAEQTLNHFFPDINSTARETKRKSLYYWRKMGAKVALASSSSKTSKMKKIRPIGTATVLPRDTELQLVKWVNEYRVLGAPVSALMLHFKALDFAEQAGLSRQKFAASWAWRKGFIKRHRLSFRARTRQGQHSPEDSAKAVEALNKTMKETMHKFDVEEVYNADQTPIFFEYVPKRTLNARGARTVWVRSGGKDKERMTCMLLGSSYGKKFTPFFVIKTRASTVKATAIENERLRHGFGKTLWKEIKALQERYHVQIYGNSTGWWTGEISTKWLDYHFKYRHEPRLPLLLLWDEFSAHWTPQVVAHANALQVHLIKVPGGHTSVCQPADVAWNAPLKQRLRLRWLQRLQEQVVSEGIQRDGIKPPKRCDVVQWVAEAWNELSASTVANGFNGILKPSSLSSEDEKAFTDPASKLESLDLLDIAVGEVADRDDVVDMHFAKDQQE